MCLEVYFECFIRSGCCICCNGCTRMLQKSVFYVSSVFLDVCCKCVLFGCYISFTHIVPYLDIVYVLQYFQVFLKCFRSIFQVYHLPSDAYCKCCIVFCFVGNGSPIAKKRWFWFTRTISVFVSARWKPNSFPRNLLNEIREQSK